MILNSIPIGIAGFITLLMIARYMEDAAYSYGVVVFAIGYLGTWKVITSFFRKAHIKRVSEGKDLGRCLGTYIAGKIALTVLYLMVVIIGVVAFRSYFESREHIDVILVLTLYMVFEIGMDIFVATYEARKEIAKIEIGKLIFAIIRMVALMIALYFGLSISGLVATYFAGIWVQIAFYIIMFKGYPIRRPSLTLMKSYIRFSIPILLAGMFTMGLDTYIGRIFVQLFWGSKDLSHYFAAWRLVYYPTVAFLVAMLLFPTFSKFHSKKLYSRISHYTHKAEKYIAFITVPSSIVLIIFTRQIVLILLSDELLLAVPMVRILAISCLFTALNIPYISQIIGTDRPWIYTLIVFIQVFLNVLILIILVPGSIFGINLAGMRGTGAAVAALVSSITAFILVRFVVRKYIVTKTKPYWRIYRIFISGAVMGIVLWVLNLVYPLENPSEGIEISLLWVSDRVSVLESISTSMMDYSYALGILIYFLAGLIAYIAMLIVLKELTRKDLRYFLDVFNPKKMLSYIWNELRI